MNDIGLAREHVSAYLEEQVIQLLKCLRSQWGNAMNKDVLEFATSTSCMMFFHNLESPATYGLNSYTEMYDLVTGDTAFDDLPEQLREDLGSQYDLENVASDWRDMCSNVLYTVRALKNNPAMETIVAEVDDYV